MKYECDMVRDLMPLCADGMASEASNRIMQAHLAECRECAAEWESVRDGSRVFPETSVPEESRQFAKSAKRLKKKHIRTLIAAVLCTVLVLGIGTLWYMTGICGGRLSPEKAAIRLMKMNHIADEFEPLRTESPQLRSEKICFLKYDDAETGGSSLIAVDVFGFGPLWFGSTIYGELEIPSEQGIYAVTVPLQLPYQIADYFYVTDPAVHEIKMTYNGEEYSVLPENCADGICPVYLAHPRYREQIRDGEVTGTAYAADGSILYTLQENTWVPAS